MSERDPSPSPGLKAWAFFLSQPPWSSLFSCDAIHNPPSWEHPCESLLAPRCPSFLGQSRLPHPGVLPVSCRNIYFSQSSDFERKVHLYLNIHLSPIARVAQHDNSLFPCLGPIVPNPSTQGRCGGPWFPVHGRGSITVCFQSRLRGFGTWERYGVRFCFGGCRLQSVKTPHAPLLAVSVTYHIAEMWRNSHMQDPRNESSPNSHRTVRKNREQS